MSINAPSGFSYIGPSLLGSMRREVRRFLLHTYTKTSRIVTLNTQAVPTAALDSWGQQTYTFGTPTTGTSVNGTVVNNIPCFYAIKEIPFPTADGLTTLNIPILTLGFDDPIKVGDHVSNIQTADGTVLIAGPVLVESLQARDPNLGGPVLIEAHLRQVEFVPSN